MMAYASVSGGVIFAPFEIQKKTRTVSYSELIAGEDVAIEPKALKKIVERQEQKKLSKVA